MSNLKTGGFQAAGNKMEGKGLDNTNFSTVKAASPVKATGQLPGFMANPRPFLRQAMPGMRSQTVGSIARPYPTAVQAGGLSVLPHKINNP